MNRRELKYIESVLERVKDPDGHVAKALAFVRKDLASYDARVGQLRDSYDADWDRFGGF